MKFICRKSQAQKQADKVASPLEIKNEPEAGTTTTTTTTTTATTATETDGKDSMKGKRENQGLKEGH